MQKNFQTGESDLLGSPKYFEAQNLAKRRLFISITRNNVNLNMQVLNNPT